MVTGQHRITPSRIMDVSTFRLRMTAAHVSLHEETLYRLAAHYGHCFCAWLTPIGSLNQKVLAGRGRADGELGVEWVRRGDIDGVHIRISKSRGVFWVSVGNSELIAKLVRGGLVAAGNGDEFSCLDAATPLAKVPAIAPVPRIAQLR